MIKQLWHSHRIALLAFAVALGALGFFGVRTIAATIYWMDPAHQDRPLAGWMTPRYVAMSYDLPRDVVLDALLLPPDALPMRISLDAIAEENNLTLDDLQARVDAAAARRDAQRDD